MSEGESGQLLRNIENAAIITSATAATTIPMVPAMKRKSMSTIFISPGYRPSNGLQHAQNRGLALIDFIHHIPSAAVGKYGHGYPRPAPQYARPCVGTRLAEANVTGIRFDSQGVEVPTESVATHPPFDRLALAAGSRGAGDSGRAFDSEVTRIGLASRLVGRASRRRKRGKTT